MPSQGNRWNSMGRWGKRKNCWCISPESRHDRSFSRRRQCRSYGHRARRKTCASPAAKRCFKSKCTLLSSDRVLYCNPFVLLKEMETLKQGGLTCDHIIISDRAQMLMPYHCYQDELEEQSASHKIGTTKKGIGPCYADKYARRGYSFSWIHWFWKL